METIICQQLLYKTIGNLYVNSIIIEKKLVCSVSGEGSNYFKNEKIFETDFEGSREKSME